MSEKLINSYQKNASDKKRSQGPKLPWWVELLFVQIGLPDSWLAKILKTKKRNKEFVSENINHIYYSILIVIALLTLLPIHITSRMKIECINNYSDYLNKTNSNYEFYNLSSENIALILCEGGSLEVDNQ